MPTQPAETTRPTAHPMAAFETTTAGDLLVAEEHVRHQTRATRATRRMVTLLAERPELRGVHAPADLFADAVRWSA